MMTMAVPSASESGTSRRGFFTSPAVKVMLFQASAEKSEPTCATPNATKRPKRPTAAETAGIQRAQEIRAGLDRLRVLHGPEAARNWPACAAALRPRKMPSNDQRDQRQRLRRGENILDASCPGCRPRVLSRGQKHDQQNARSVAARKG